MKKILIVLLVPLLFACSKDSSNDPVPYTTKYKVGHEYVQTFYVQGKHVSGGFSLLSIDDRLPYDIFPDDEVFAQIAPTDTSRPDVSESREIKLYQVANLRFKFKATDWSNGSRSTMPNESPTGAGFSARPKNIPLRAKYTSG